MRRPFPDPNPAAVTVKRAILPFLSLAALLLARDALADELDPAPTPELIATSADAAAAEPPGAEDVLLPLQRTVAATHPLVRYNLARTTGVLHAPGDAHTSTIQRLSVALRWNLGDFLSLRYTPLWTFYSDDAFDDNLSHDAAVDFERGLGEWNVRARYRYNHSSNPLVDTGRQTTQQNQRFDAAVQRELGYRTTLELGLDESDRSGGDYAGYHDWSGDGWLHYQLSEWISTSAGLTCGYVNTSGPSMNYGRVDGRVRWHLSEKIDADLRAGLERRRFADSARPDADTPVYGASVLYHPLPTTLFTLNGDRVIVPSYFAGDVDRVDSWQATLAQRLFGRVHGYVAYVVRTAFRRSIADADAPARDDTGYAVKLRLSTNFRSNGTVAIYYQNKRNDSTDNGYSFDGSETGLELTLVF